MKVRLLFLSLIFTSLAFSQQEASVWYFGQEAGIKFNNDGSVTTLTDGQLDTSEGCATLSDSNGSLLFYTDGIKVWNRNHQIMPNGNGLMGDPSTTQSATIVQLPGSSTLFYVFTLDAFAGANGFRYSEVDISLNGGLGAVTANKNILIYTPSNEKLAIVKHNNNTDYWVVTHGWNNNTFFSYLLTSAGLSSIPTISNVGAITGGNTGNVFGYMKIAPNGSKIAICNSTIDAELLDFNNSTGVVSNPIILNVTNNGFHYGAEFSTNSEILYVSLINYLPATSQIIQYNLIAVNIPASALTIYSDLNNIPAALQIGPNNKIYFAKINKTNLGVINNPDVLGLGCNVQPNGVDLAGRTCGFGLPPFVSSFFNSPAILYSGSCFGQSTSFQFNTSQSIVSAFWDFGDGSTSNSSNPSHTYALPGNYTVSATVTTTSGTGTSVRTITIAALPIIANTITNQAFCGTANINYNLVQFNATVLGSQPTSTFGVAYFTSLANATSHTNPFTSINLPFGTTTLFTKVYNLTNVNCFAITSFTVNLSQKTIANTANAIFICDDVSNDGIGNFNLQNNTAAILGLQNSTDFLVSYHLSQNDADLDLNPLPTNYQNTSNPQTIYARVESIISATCFATTTFGIGLYKMPIANQVQNIYKCDAANDGTESFDLNVQNASVLGLQLPTNFTVSYHATQADANSGSNSLATNISVLNFKTIYVRIENVLSAACFATTFFDAIVKPSPMLNLNATYTICQGNPIAIAAPNGFDSYTWSNGATTPATTINQAGNYTLTVTQNHGTITCSDTQTISVLNSDVATVTSIEIQDWTDNQNSIAVFATGDGNYEYSLDGILYQDSNAFYGLTNGQYTVYVRDKNGCGVVNEDLFLLMYPKFFTPNSDGNNDYWKIKFSNSEPKMIVHIYDRYGYMVKQLSSLSNGWDGTNNGQQLISDDYWFVVKRENGKEFKGHFTLKR